MEVVLNIDALVRLLEVKACSRVPGTVISRSYCSVEYLRSRKVRVPRGKKPDDTMLVWCLGVGNLVEPKFFLYDHTIEGVVKKAIKLAFKRKDSLKPRTIEDALRDTTAEKRKKS